MTEQTLTTSLLVVDVSNLYYCIRHAFGDTARLDYSRYVSRIMEEVNIGKAIAYGAEMNHVASGFKAVLHRLGFQTKYKQPKIYANSRKADWDVGMAMDVVRLAKNFDTIVFGTADGDLAPCIEYIREKYTHKRCLVYASGISRDLRSVAHGCWEIEAGDLECQPVRT